MFWFQSCPTAKLGKHFVLALTLFFGLENSKLITFPSVQGMLASDMLKHSKYCVVRPMTVCHFILWASHKVSACLTSCIATTIPCISYINTLKMLNSERDFQMWFLSHMRATKINAALRNLLVVVTVDLNELSIVLQNSSISVVITKCTGSYVHCCGGV